MDEANSLCLSCLIQALDGLLAQSTAVGLKLYIGPLNFVVSLFVFCLSVLFVVFPPHSRVVTPHLPSLPR